jgi:arsenate reductase (thioredoxin)
MSDLPVPRRVLFICYGNACRSPMAESIGRALLADATVDSAGLIPLGFVPDEAKQVLSEAGYDPQGLDSKPVTDERLARATHVIDLCGAWSPPPGFRKPVFRWPVRDPYRLPLDVWRATRDDLIARIRGFAP